MATKATVEKRYLQMAARIRAEMAFNGVRQDKLASVLGISRVTVNRRINHAPQEFTLGEIDAMARYLKTTREVLIGG